MPRESNDLLSSTERVEDLSILTEGIRMPSMWFRIFSTGKESLFDSTGAFDGILDDLYVALISRFVKHT